MDTKELTFSTLNKIFSKARMQPFTDVCNNPSDALEGYHKNIKLSEAMLPSLHYLEVCFRNSLDEAFKNHFGADWLIKGSTSFILPAADIQKINEICKRFEKTNKRPPCHNDLVAQMTFGFWSALFHRKFDPLIWHRKNIIRDIFPNMLRQNRKRSFIETKLLTIKEVRNRIAHHEPVLRNKVSIKSAHEASLELIQSMSKEAFLFLQSIDRFPGVYASIFGSSQKRYVSINRNFGRIDLFSGD